MNLSRSARSKRKLGFSSACALLLAPALAAAQPAPEPPPVGEAPAPAAAPGEPAETPTPATDGPQPADTPPAAEPASEPAAPVAAEPVATLAPAAEAPAEEAPAEESKPVAGYEKGFFLASEDGQHKLQIGARIQTRFTFEALENDTNETNFSIPRARVALKGHVYDILSFKLETDIGKGFASLKDGYGSVYLGSEWSNIRAGQFKRPFSRQQINSSGNQQFVDRAITDSAFGAGRDIGFAFHNNYEKSPEIEYALGVFNGTGDKASFSGSATVDPMTGEGTASGKFSNVPSNAHPAVVARIGYNSADNKGYSEADLEGGPVRFGIAASGWFDFLEPGSEEIVTKAEADFNLKVEGFSTTGAFYICSAGDDVSCFGGSDEAMGGHLQLGYVIGKLFEPAVRVASVGSAGNIDDLQEFAFALSLYPVNHKLKLQTDFSVLSTSDATDYMSRTQLQFAF